MNISNSQVGLYKTCHFAYYAKYFLKIEEPENPHFEFGKLFHSSIPKLRAKDKRVSKMIKALKSHEKFIELHNRKPIWEDKQYVSIEGLPFVVIMDGNLDDTILEFKTSAKVWSPKKFCEEYQPHIYMRAEFERTGIWKNFFYFVVTKEDKPKVQYVQIMYDEDKWKEIESHARSILTDFEYKPTCEDYFYCNNFCNFKQHCPKFN